MAAYGMHRKVSMISKMRICGDDSTQQAITELENIRNF